MKGEMKTGISISIQEFIQLIKKNLFAIVLTGIICGAAAFAITSLFVPQQYEAGAKLIVNAKQDTTVAITNDQITSSQKLVDMYSVIVKSRSVLERVIDKLELDMSYEQLQKCVTASSVNGTQIMQVSVRNTSSSAAEKILRQILLVAPDVIIDSIEAGSVKTVEGVYSSDVPVAPNKSLYTAVAMLLGWVLSVAFVTLKYVSDDSFKSADEITEKLGVPVIGTIPKIF